MKSPRRWQIQFKLVWVFGVKTEWDVPFGFFVGLRTTECMEAFRMLIDRLDDLTYDIDRESVF